MSGARQNQEWYTPQWIIDAVRLILGGIDLDPATCPFAQKRIQAADCFYKEDDGLHRDWNGSVFLNPPYNDCARWIEKLLEELHFGRTSQALLLCNNATDTDWVRACFQSKYFKSVLFFYGRVYFVDTSGVERKQPLQGQMLIGFETHARVFQRVCSKYGAVFHRLKV